MSGSVPSWARVGAKVVCVDNRLRLEGDTTLLWGALQKNAVYTITGSFIGDGSEKFGALLTLRDMPLNYFACRFRPLVTDEQREADLAQFRKLLTIREPEAA